MHDTIDMLEAIGQDASLRYADGETLADHGTIETGSEALKGAILRGSRADLLVAMGLQPMQSTQISQMPRREEEDPDQEEGDEPTPDNPDSPKSI